jgi:NADPH-dependent glutamate synthase beta subunit-like oxidoreductase
MGVPGEDLPGVVGGLEFLREVNLGSPPRLSGRVIVIGGGNVAMDAARSALRLGADEVCVVYRRTRAEMPAHEWEIREAEQEGVRFCYLTAPLNVIEEGGRAVGLLCQRMELGKADARGRRQPVPVAGSEYLQPAALVIAAVGQGIDSGFLAALGLEVREDGTVAADSFTQATRVEGVFAGGDVVTGPATAVHAMGDGRRAAESIRRYLDGLPLTGPAPPARSLVAVGPPPEAAGAQARIAIGQRPLPQRVGSFDEVELGLSLDQALAEAQRCLRCGREEQE